MIELTRRQALGTAAAATAGFGILRSAKAETALIDQALQQGVNSGRLAGVAAAAATDKGTLYEGAFGKRNIAAGPAATPDTVFWIASMTKAVTTAAAMQQVERGKLALHEPVGDILPELAKPEVLEGFDANGTPRLRSANAPITLHHLLTHTAGYTYDIWDPMFARYEKYADMPAIGTCKNAALMRPLDFDPGARWDYGINIDWAGKMVERVSGKTIDQYFADEIFGPLGMTSTGFFITPDMRARLSAMHARGPDGRLGVTQFEMPQHPEFYMGGGGLYSTAGDYLKFVQMILHGGNCNGRQVLRPETVAMMAQNQIGELNVHVLKTAAPGLSNDAEFFPGMMKKWGYGFMINTMDVAGGRAAGSLAWAGLANTYFWIDPKRHVAGVIMMQLLPFADGPALQEFADFESAVYKAAQSV
ncbi:MAG: beta-lactamase family protein [Alphaproteobacteria bacterium]|nr:beta-lactamase family protein [Alphaproteobacteria bacterium]